MRAAHFDILIVGAGVIGNAIAYHLSRQGRKVLVVERSQIADSPAASWASAGGVRRQGRHPAEAKLALEAIQRWKTLELELEADLHYRRGGNLLLAESDTETDRLSKFVDTQHEMGFALAPAIGRCVADQINGLPTPELKALNPTRIATFSPESIEAFMTDSTKGDFLA